MSNCARRYLNWLEPFRPWELYWNVFIYFTRFRRITEMKFTNLQDTWEHWILSQEEKEIVHELQIILEAHLYTDVPDKTHLQELVRQKRTFSSSFFF